MAVKVAIVGGGPSGALCGYHLAKSGVDVHLYESNPDREKPCGGGLTLRALNGLTVWPRLNLAQSKVTRFRLISPSRRQIDLELTDPIRIVSRRHLDNALRRLAVAAGATLVKQAVRKPRPSPHGGWQVNGDHADIIVGAGGINDPVARYKGLSFAAKRRGRAIGYYVPGRFPRHIICRFFPGLWGYAWWFPRPDHASLGIELMGGSFTLHLAKSLIKQFVRQDLHPLMGDKETLSLKNAQAYTWSEPLPDKKTLATRRFSGRDWLLIGDAAGLVDSLTGEGLPYAFLSGKMAADAIRAGRLETYADQLKKKILPELRLAARMSPVFYSSLHLRSSLFVLAKSQTMQTVTNDMALGHLNYREFKKRMLRDAPRIIRDLGYDLAGRILTKGDRHAC